MLFELLDFYVGAVESRDIKEIVEVYNSNREFLISHMDKETISNEWMHQELKSMKEVGFHSCKIIEKKSEKIVGVMDFKISDESYLSLLMLHKRYKSKGLGKAVYQGFSDYAKSLNSKCIKIDVVTNYDNSVLDFWISNGFNEYSEVELNWTGKILPAITMYKNI